MLFVLAGTIGCGAYAAEKAEPLTPRTKALAEAIKSVRDGGPFYSERHARLLMQLTEATVDQIDNLQVKMQEDIASKQKLLESIDANCKRIFKQRTDQSPEE